MGMVSGDNRRVSPSTASAPTAADLVDWDAAVRLARLAVPAGPRVPTATRRAPTHSSTPADPRQQTTGRPFPTASTWRRRKANRAC